MKTALTLIALLFTAQLSVAQYFTLTPKGFLSEDQSEYIVIDIPDSRQADLYKNVLNALSTMYKNPKEVLSLTEGESITLSAYEPKTIIYKGRINPLQIGKTTFQYDLSYSITILFKDGKIRFNRPSFECRRWYENGYKQGWTSGWTYMNLVKGKDGKFSIFDTNGEIISQEAFDGLNKHLNSLIGEIIEKSKKVNDW